MGEIIGHATCHATSKTKWTEDSPASENGKAFCCSRSIADEYFNPEEQICFANVWLYMYVSCVLMSGYEGGVE